jgi:hypothetical protein
VAEESVERPAWVAEETAMWRVFEALESDNDEGRVEATSSSSLELRYGDHVCSTRRC